MPIKQAAKKAMRQAKKRALRNAIVKNAYKDAVKAVRKAMTAGEVSVDLMRAAQQKLDKAAKRGVIKKKAAARKLSRLAAQVKKVVKK
ncbi:MAG: 30S ribosomal protein S20 [Patescibacteria group bacterium]